MNNMQYEMQYQEMHPTQSQTLLRRISRNLYIQVAEHMETYQQRIKGATKESFVFKHQQERHGWGEPSFTAKVTKVYNNCLTRQVSEAVYSYSKIRYRSTQLQE